MRPRFGTTTRALSALFVLAALGAGIAAVTAGDQTTSGHAGDRLILSTIAVGSLVVGVGLWAELLWAWWTGFLATTATIAMTFVLHAPDGIAGVLPWVGAEAVFGLTLVQGRRMQRATRDEHGS